MPTATFGYNPAETGLTAHLTTLADAIVGSALTCTLRPNSQVWEFTTTAAVGTYLLTIKKGSVVLISGLALRVTSDAAVVYDGVGAALAVAENQTEHDATQAAIEGIELNPIIAPVIGYADTRVRQSTIPLYVGDTADRSITLIDSITLEPVDIEEIDLQLVVETVRKGDVKTYANNELTKSGNTVVFTPTSAMVASERTLNFALKPTVTGHPLAWGIMPVTYVPRSGTS